MNDTTRMDVDPQLQKEVQKEEENVQKLLEKAKETIKAVKEKNEKEVTAAKEKARLALVKPKEALKAALLYKKALKAKKRLLGIEPEPPMPFAASKKTGRKGSKIKKAQKSESELEITQGSAKAAKKGSGKRLKYRTKPCRFFEQSAGCKMGDNCKFIHVQNPELVDGQDILKELHEGGELKTMSIEDMSGQTDFNALVNKAPLMVFMKGNPAKPLCVLSQALIKILWDAKVGYESYDVSSDENVFQGLKKLSNCNTYPQVFVNGIFVGDLDTIKSLQESGDLNNKLKIHF